MRARKSAVGPAVERAAAALPSRAASGPAASATGRTAAGALRIRAGEKSTDDRGARAGVAFGTVG